MPYRRRLLALLAAAVLVGIPAGVLRAACVGNSCREPAGADVRLPFCSLPDRLKEGIAAGFRDGRSPVILAIAGPSGLAGTVGPGASPSVPWPIAEERPDNRVPIVFAGAGVVPGAAVPPGTGLRDVAPTLEQIVGIRRPHPEVRSGTAVDGVASGEGPRLVLMVALKGVGTADVEDASASWPTLRRLLDEGAGSLEGVTGSLPLDPAATLATIGTGALPTEHGITGTFLRNDRARLVRAWGRAAPLTIVATLGDDLDDRRGERPRVGLVADDPADQGLLGGSWYVEHDRDDLAVVPPRDVLPAVRGLLEAGYGADAEPDLLGVVLRGGPRRVDTALDAIVGLAERATGGATTVVVAGTGSAGGSRSLPDAGEVVREVEASVGASGLVEAAAAGGLFLDQRVTAREGISSDRVVRVLLELRGPDGTRRFADAFPSFAVSFARYC